jgi:hypothetical protein
VTPPSRTTPLPWPMLEYFHALSKSWLGNCVNAGESHLGLAGKRLAPGKGTDK